MIFRGSFRFLIVLGFAAVVPEIVMAQELQPPDTIVVAPQTWRHSLGTSFTITQISFTDWAQGGDNALAYATGIIGNSTYDWYPITWSNSYRFAFGQTRISGGETRKTDDKIDMESVLSYKLTPHVTPYAAVSLKTQFALGFKYNKDGTSTATSKFLDPGYIVESIGLEYPISPGLKTRFGFALREIVTRTFTSFADDPGTPHVESVKVEDGMESVTEGTWKLDPSMSLNAKLELFSSFKNPEKVVLRGDNTFVAKLGKIVTLIVNVQLINERRVTPRTQIKQSVALGISYTVF